MKSVKIDRYLRAGIGALALVFVYVIYAAIYEHIVVAGDTAPSFTITADNGKTVSLPDFGGKVLILNFWASWCAPCVRETPSLSQFAKDYADKGVVVLGISVDQKVDAYQNFLRRFVPNFLTVRNDKIHETYGTYMYPETYIIDSKGKVVKKVPETPDSPAEVNWADPSVRAYINGLL